MSKSRGTFIKARTYLNHLNPEYLRYYFAAKLNHRIEDLDFQIDDFIYRVNSDLVGKFINIASRAASFINKHFSSTLADTLSDPDLFHEAVKMGDIIAEKYEKLEYHQAIRLIMSLADRINQYIDEKKPWAAIKDSDRQQEVHQVCSLGINLFRLLTIYLKPILPVTTKNIEEFLNCPPFTWQDKNQPLLNHQIKEFKPLLQRIEKQQVDTMMESAKESIAAAAAPAPEKKPYISIEDFAKLDLRTAKVINAEHVEGADKLLRLELDIGEEKPRQVFAGIKSAYEPEKLIGKLVVMVANLEPRKMRFGLSEGMVLAAGPGGKEIWVVSPDEGAEPGMKVK